MKKTSKETPKQRGGESKSHSAGRPTRKAERKLPDVDGVPPTRNLKKRPDEAYGDTEIPERR